MTTYEKIKALCEEEGFHISSIGDKIPALKVNKASVTGWKKGAKPRADKIKAMADYFGVSVEYLTGDSSVSVRNVQDNHGIIGHAHAPVTINGSGTASLSEQEEALLDLFRKMNVVSQAKLLVYAESVLNGQI